MSNVELAFIVLNSVLLGAGILLIDRLRWHLATVKSERISAEKSAEECKKIVATIVDAHNGLAQRVLKVEDGLKAAELRSAQRSFVKA